MKKIVLAVGLALAALLSGCLLVAAGAIEADKQNHHAAPPPSTPSVEAGAPASSAAPAPTTSSATPI